MRIDLRRPSGLMPEEDLDSPEIPCEHCQMTGKRVPPGVERRILGAESRHLVLEPRLEGMNIDFAAISLGEGPAGCPFLATEELIEDSMSRDGSFSVSYKLPECFSLYDDPPGLEIDLVPLEVDQFSDAHARKIERSAQIWRNTLEDAQWNPDWNLPSVPSTLWPFLL